MFHCREDAEKSLLKLQKSHPYFNLNGQVHAIEKYKSAGRPSSAQEKHITGYQMTFEIERNEELIQQHKRRKGRFILATNELDSNQMPSASY